MKTGFKNNLLLLFTIIILASSCTTTKIINVEIPRPGKQELPENIQSLLLVNRTVDDNYSDLESDSLQNIFYKNSFNLDTTINDVQAADTLLKVLGELLYESGRYDYVIPENRFLPHKKNAFFTESMSWDEAKNLCETYNTDAVLSVDMFNTKVITKYDKDTYFDPSKDNFTNILTAEMEVAYQALFKIYDPAKEQVLVRQFMKDTVLWEDAAYSVRGLFERFTPVKKALSEASIALALDFTDKVCTNWREERRPIFMSGGTQMKQAGILIDGGKWEDAMNIWKSIETENKSKAAVSKAQYNLAVGYELQGDINKAIKKGLDSYNNMYHQMTYEYLEYLKKRKKELEKQ